MMYNRIHRVREKIVENKSKSQYRAINYSTWYEIDIKEYLNTYKHVSIMIL